MAIALVIVGGSLLETGGLALTPRESSDFPAPTAVVTGSGDALVAMAMTGRDASLAFTGGDASTPVSILARRADPADAAASVLRALDPDAPADLALAMAGGAAASGVSETRAVGASATQQRRKRKRGPWRISPRVTWYGPGFYGNRTACGQRYTRHIVGVAHRTLPCGTLVQFR